MRQLWVAAVWGLVLGFSVLVHCRAEAAELDPAFSQTPLGPERASGVVVWNHGRSINVEDSDSPTPPYLRVLRDAGWDVLRFNRPRNGDTLSASTRRLVDQVGQLKRKGYHRIVLAGQSFGAFLALMAADASDDVDAVVATAPAAFGSFDEFYDSWRLNATRLYPLLERVKRARVMLFYFHGDDFDPGGRGERSRAILSTRPVGYSVVDQPAFLVGHWASSTGLFMRRFGNCIRDFVDAPKIEGEQVCEPDWGEKPSADLRLPDELTHRRAARHLAAAGAGASAPSSSAAASVPGAGRNKRETWYGFYPNGREILLVIDDIRGRDLNAVYAIGPGIDENEPAEWSRRKGRLVDDEFVFDEKGKSTLRFRPRADGGLSATWISPDGKTSMQAGLRPLDLLHLSRRAEAR
ncbi:MAG: alpha/beta hydrolase family protein [Stellaceae bacterium]|jgi:pimeloyl-ACP methyl ester carboxylesterase